MKPYLITRNGCIPYNPKLKERARELRNNATEPENKLWFQYLRQLPFTFHRQKVLNNYIVDFYCTKLELVIEIDGDSHFTEDTIEYDKERTAILESYGLKVIRFNNDDVMKNFESVCAEIEKLVRGRIPVNTLSRIHPTFKKRGLKREEEI